VADLAARVMVPKAAMDENQLPAAWEHDVWSARQVMAM
jgi:hypothetical protein